MAVPEAVLDRLSHIARAAEEATDALDLRDGERQLARLRREPQNLTTAAGQALAAVQAEKRAVERAARAAELRALPTLADAEMTAADRRTPR